MQRHQSSQLQTVKMKLTDNVFGRVDASIQFVHVQGIAKFSFDLVIVLLVRHTETICNLNYAFLNGACTCVCV